MGSEVGEGEIKVAVDSGRITPVEVASGSAPTFGTGAQAARKRAKRKKGKKNFMLFFSGVGQLADRCQAAPTGHLSRLTPESSFRVRQLAGDVGEQAPQSLEYTVLMEDIYKTYPHNPPHYFVPNAMYIVTGAILHNKRLLKSDKHKLLVMDILLERAAHWKWDLEAWAFLENHYHFIARAPENALTLEKLIRQIHSKSAVELNKLDKH